MAKASRAVVRPTTRMSRSIIRDSPTSNVTFSPGGNPNVGYGTNFGVINIVNCTNVTLGNLHVTNNRTYSGSTLQTQSSCALNIANSTGVVIETPRLIKGKGKSVVLVHGNSTVTVNGYNEGPDDRSVIQGYYFELNIGASDLTVNDVLVSQKDLPNDSHSAVVAVSSYNSTNGGPASRNSSINLNNVEFVMENGRPIVSGNTDDFSTVSTVTLNNAKIRTASGDRGLLRWHLGASNSIVVNLSGTTKLWNANGAFSPVDDYRTVTPQDMVNYITTTDPDTTAASGISGLGRFVNYDSPEPVAYGPGTTTTSDGFSAYSVTNRFVKQP